MPSILDTLSSSIDSADLGRAVKSDDGAIVLADLPDIIVAGLPLHATLLNETGANPMDWAGGAQPGGFGAWRLDPGDRPLPVTRTVGGTEYTYNLKTTVLPASPRIRFVAPAGTPEDDSAVFMQFVHAYRDYIIQACRATNWPSGGVCPRLLAAIVYASLPQCSTASAAISDTQFYQQRSTWDAKLGRITSSPPDLIRLDYWDDPVGVCQLPLYLVGAWRQNALTALLQAILKASNGTWVLTANAEYELLFSSGVPGFSVPQALAPLVDWFNLAHFPKSNILATARIIDALRQLDITSVIASSQPTDAVNMTGGWPPNLTFSDTYVKGDPNELRYLLAAFDRLRNIGSVRQVGARTWASTVLAKARLPVMDLYFNLSDDYGGYALRQGDKDATASPYQPKYAGEVWTYQAATTYVNKLATDLRGLGFLTAGRVVGGAGSAQTLDPSMGTFNNGTDWAVREFQIQAGMEVVTTVDADHDTTAPNDINYESYLQAVDPNPVRYTGPISGVANLETRALIQYWKRKRYRYPVVVSARDPNTGVIYGTAPNRANLWHRRDMPSSAPRMYARDFTHYYQNHHTVGEYPAPSDDRIVTGEFQDAFDTGPVARHIHSWDSATVTWGRLTAAPKPGQTGYRPETQSSMKAVLAVSYVESDDHFDCPNAYDTGIVSSGVCQWTLAGELGALLALYKARYNAEFNMLFRRFGIDVRDWGTDGDIHAIPDLRVFNATPRRVSELDPAAPMCWSGPGNTGVLQFDYSHPWPGPAASATGWGGDDMEYFRTWPFFYRFVMAARAGQGFRRAQWLVARIRLRDLQQIVWKHDPAHSDYLTVGAGGRAATFADVFTSEKAMALIYRWHVNLPGGVLDLTPATNPPTTRRPEASSTLRTAIRQYVWEANKTVFGTGTGATWRLSPNVLAWNYARPVAGGPQDEAVLPAGLLNFIRYMGTPRAATGSTPAYDPTSYWKNLKKSCDDVDAWAGYSETAPNFSTNQLSTYRNSFLLDTGGAAGSSPEALPPVPQKFLDTV